MYVVFVINNSGRRKEWDRFYEPETASRERNLLIVEHAFHPEEVFVEDTNQN